MPMKTSKIKKSTKKPKYFGGGGMGSMSGMMGGSGKMSGTDMMSMGTGLLESLSKATGVDNTNPYGEANTEANKADAIGEGLVDVAKNIPVAGQYIAAVDAVSDMFPKDKSWGRYAAGAIDPFTAGVTGISMAKNNEKYGISKGKGVGLAIAGFTGMGGLQGKFLEEVQRDADNEQTRADRIKQGTLYSKEGGKFSLGGKKGTYNGLLKGQLKELDKDTYITGPANMTHKSGNDQPLDTDGDGIANLKMEGNEMIHQNYMYSKKTVKDLKLKNKFKSGGDLIDQKTKQLNHLTARQYNDKTLAQKGMTDRMSMSDGGTKSTVTLSPNSYNKLAKNKPVMSPQEFQKYLADTGRTNIKTYTPGIPNKGHEVRAFGGNLGDPEVKFPTGMQARPQKNFTQKEFNYYVKPENWQYAPQGTNMDSLLLGANNFIDYNKTVQTGAFDKIKQVEKRAGELAKDDVRGSIGVGCGNGQLDPTGKCAMGSEISMQGLNRSSKGSTVKRSAAGNSTPGSNPNSGPKKADGGSIGTGNTVADMLYWNTTKQNRSKLEQELPSMFSKGDYPSTHYTGAEVPYNAAEGAMGTVNLQRHFKTVQGMQKQMEEKALGGTMLKGNRMVNKNGGKMYDNAGEKPLTFTDEYNRFGPTDLMPGMNKQDYNLNYPSGMITNNTSNSLRFKQSTNKYTSPFSNTNKELQFDHNTPKLDFNKPTSILNSTSNSVSNPKVGLSKGEWGALGAGAFDSAAQLAMAWKNKPHKVNYDDIASKYDYDTSKALSGLDYGEGEAIKDIQGTTNRALDTTSHPSYQTRQALVNNTLKGSASNIAATRGQFAQARTTARIGVAGQSANLRFQTRSTKDLINTQEEDAYRQAKADALKNTSNAMYTTANTLNANQYRKDFLNSNRFIGYNDGEYTTQVPDDATYVKYGQNKFGGKIKKSIKRK